MDEEVVQVVSITRSPARFRVHVMSLIIFSYFSLHSRVSHSDSNLLSLLCHSGMFCAWCEWG